MRRASGFFAIIFVNLLFFTLARAETPVNQSEMASDIQAALALSHINIPTGAMDVKSNLGNTSWKWSQPSPNVPRQIEVSTNFLPQLQTLERLGVVFIRHDQELQRYKSGQSFDFNTFNQSFNGLVDRITVAVHDQYRSLIAPDGWTLHVPAGTFSSVKVVKVDYRTIGIETYAAVFFTYHAEYNSLYVSLVSARDGILLSNDRKGILLVKLDNFTNKWKGEPGVPWDTANMDQSFRSNFVQNKLLQLSSGIPR